MKFATGRRLLPFPKKLLYYCLLAGLTLLAIEGMARATYWLAFEGSEGADYPGLVFGWAPKHPVYGFTRWGPEHDLNVMPPRQKREDLALIGLFGGSVADQVTPYVRREVAAYFSANNLERRPVVLNMARGVYKQPQQVMVAANTLLLGGHFDIIVNLDGYNEIAPTHRARQWGEQPFFPENWNTLASLTALEAQRAARYGILREELQELRRSAETHPLRYTAFYGIINHYRAQRIEGQISQGSPSRSGYRLEQRGPRRVFRTDAEFNREAGRVWYRGALLLGEMASLTGAEYYHFLQPNQYVPPPPRKLPTDAALACCYAAGGWREAAYREIYPEVVRFGEKLTGRRVNYFDLSRIFRGNAERVYQDKCCHLNERGNEMLAAALVERLEPALRRVGEAGPAASGLEAAAGPAELLMDGYFQVYRRAGKRLVYVREDCVAADTAAAFFLHIIPADGADLPPERREYGFDNRDFRFADAGRLIGGRCTAGRQMPDYPIASIRTGQYVEGEGKLWEGEYRFEE